MVLRKYGLDQTWSDLIKLDQTWKTCCRKNWKKHGFKKHGANKHGFKYGLKKTYLRAVWDWLSILFDLETTGAIQIIIWWLISKKKTHFNFGGKFEFGTKLSNYIC